jgi:hypothetical protein
VRQSRSIIFYAWALFAAQLALAAGVITFVLAGGARQRADVTDLHTRAQTAQLTNLTMVDEFLNAQRAVRGYQATGELGLLSEYHTAKIRCYVSLARLGRLAGANAAGLVATQGRLAEQAFDAADQASVAGARISRAAGLCPAGSTPRTAPCGHAWPGRVPFLPRRAAAHWAPAWAG